MARSEEKKPERSVYLGVSKGDRYGFWADIRQGGKVVRLGRFATEKRAAIAPDRVLRGLGENLELLNFPKHAFGRQPSTNSTRNA